MTDTRETAEHLRNKLIPVIEIFNNAIQGEGPHIGTPTAFIRFGGCDFKCGMCDSIHAIDPSLIQQHAKYMTQEDIAKELYKIGPHTAVTLSGGNPCIHDLTRLVYLLKFNNLFNFIHVETQGTIWKDWLVDCQSIVISPKTPCMKETISFKAYETFLEQIYKQYKNYVLKPKFHFKFVVNSSEDLDWIEGFLVFFNDTHASTPTLNNTIFLSQLNSYPNDKDITHEQLREHLIMSYNRFHNKILVPHDLWKRYEVRYLPQLHVLMHGNDREV